MDNERIVKVAIGSKVRVAAKVSDGAEGARWVLQQIDLLRLDPRSIEFGQERDAYTPMSDVWLEGYVTGATSDPEPS